MAVIDLSGFVSQLKDHLVEHSFHIHEEQHVVETYSLSQSWYIYLHPEDACNGPMDLKVSLSISARELHSFEDKVAQDEELATNAFPLEVKFEWELPPIREGLDTLALALDLARFGDLDFPVSVGVRHEYKTVTDQPTHHLIVHATHSFSLNKIYMGEEFPCKAIVKAMEVSRHLLDQSSEWLTLP